MADLIDRQAAIDAILAINDYGNSDRANALGLAEFAITTLPSVEPTLYGYNVKHLDLIARVLQKEDIPPERVTEVLTDIGRIVAIVQDEFIETLRRAVQNAEGRTDG